MKTTNVKRVLQYVCAALIAACSPGLMVSGQAPQAIGTWAATGAIADSRLGAASAVLADGRTLIAGGTTAGTPTASIVIYNSLDNSFVAAGLMSAARVGHTATVLEDGRVLIAGGSVGGVVSTDLEIFNPADATTALVGTMATARAAHAAARLADGTVLLVGGSDGAAALATSEVFDPVTNATTAAGTLSVARSGASATTLIDGRVLVAGGYNGTTDLASAEMFYAFAQTFEPVPTTLSSARSGHSAVLLPHNNSVLVAGGTSAGTALQASDLFLPAQFPDPYSYGMGSFAQTGAMTTPRANAASGPGAEGYAFVAGGGVADAEKYHFATIRTDKDDYAPGQQAVITGSGWQPNEIVTLLFQEDPAVHEDYVLQVQADANGNVYWDQWAPEEHDIGVRFYLMASDSMSRAQMTFTDNVKFVRAQTASPVAATVSATSYSTNESCTGASTALGSFALTSASATLVTNANTNGRSVKLTAPPNAVSPAGYTFSNWTSSTGGPFVTVPGEPEAICIGGSNGNQDETYVPNYAAPSTATLNVIKHVVNDNGGTAAAGDWNLAVSSTDSGTGTGSAAGAESPGTSYTVQAGKTYSVTESGGPFGYAESKSADCTNLVPVAGNTYTCTITNDDIAPRLTVTKVVVNDNGGTKTAADFPLFVDGNLITSGVQGTFNAGPHTVTETGDATYAAAFGGDCAADGSITLAPGDARSCTITNDDIGPKLTVTKVVVNDNGGDKMVVDFPLFVDGNPVTSGVQATFSAGAHTVTETGIPTYAAAFTGDCAPDGALTLALGEVKTCTITNDDIQPTLIVIKSVVNDNGGTATADAFTMSVTGTNLSSASFPGAEAPGTEVGLDAGAYSVAETGPSGYQRSDSADCSGSIALGETKTCIITNDDIQPKLTVIKHVVNDNGGRADADDFTMSVTGTDVSPTSFAGAESPGTEVGLDAGSYSVNESGPGGYQRSDSGECTGSIGIGETKTCTITNDDIAPTLTVIKHVVNDHGGAALASAWTLSVSSSNAGAGTGSAPGAAAPGTAYTLEANKAYSVAESNGPSGYAASASVDCTIANAVLATDYSCTITNDDIQPKLIVIKNVINDNGGTAAAGDFTLSVTGTDVAPSSFAGVSAPGVLVGLDAGTYSVSESGPFGYARSDSADCAGSIGVGETRTCTITNNDIQPTLVVIKHVINNNGGSAVSADFTMTVTGTHVSPAGFPGAEAPGTVVKLDAGAYSVAETGPGLYAQTNAADCAGSIGVGQTKTCTVTNDDIYEFIGFFEPVENLPVLNGVNAGRAIPLKWELRNASGNLVLDLATVTGITYVQVACGVEPVDQIELPAGDAGTSELRLTSTGYHFNWKTEKSFASKCYELRISLSDSSTHSARFKFKK